MVAMFPSLPGNLMSEVEIQGLFHGEIGAAQAPQYCCVYAQGEMVKIERSEQKIEKACWAEDG